MVLETPDRYKNLLICLLSGLQEFNFDVVLGENVRITLVARVRRCLESLWKREVRFSLDQLYEIINAVLLGNDYHTGCRIIQIISQGTIKLSTWVS